MEFDVYEPADFPAFSAAIQAALAYVANNEGVTSNQIIESTGSSRPYMQKKIAWLYSKKFIKSRGYAAKLARNNKRQRLYVVDEKAFQPKEEAEKKKHITVFDTRREASQKDNDAQRKLLEQARQFGRFGVLVAQATINQKRRVKNHV